MKILQVNKFYFPEYGTERYLFGLMAQLEHRGHTVIPFAMQHPKNRLSSYSKYFVSQVDVSEARLSLRSIKIFARMIYSLEARRKFSRLLDDTQPDVVHVHSIHHHISPSILREATKRGIPIVQTLHDYKLVCPSYFFPMRNGQPCTECRRGKWFHLIRHRAHKESLVSTTLLALESFVHSIFKMYERHVYRFIAPSNDMGQRLVELGVDPKQLTVIPHAIDAKEWRPATSSGSGILFAGRLMPDRGLDQMLYVARALPSVIVKIAGDGPERAALESKIKMQGIKNVQVLGRLAGDELKKEFRAARLVFFPSFTLDTFGLAVLEAMASGKPVVATKLGGVLDLVTDGETGYLYDPRTPDQAVDGIKKILSDEALARNFGRKARKVAEEFSVERHYESLISLYGEAIVSQTAKQLERQFAAQPAVTHATV